MKSNIFVEIGIGNKNFVSTEIEKGKKEKRVSRFIKPKKINGVYLRIWLFKKVLTISTYDGIKFKKKRKNRFKLLFGIEGVN